MPAEGKTVVGRGTRMETARKNPGLSEHSTERRSRNPLPTTSTWRSRVASTIWAGRASDDRPRATRPLHRTPTAPSPTTDRPTIHVPSARVRPDGGPDNRLRLDPPRDPPDSPALPAVEDVGPSDL